MEFKINDKVQVKDECVDSSFYGPGAIGKIVEIDPDTGVLRVAFSSGAYKIINGRSAWWASRGDLQFVEKDKVVQEKQIAWAVETVGEPITFKNLYANRSWARSVRKDFEEYWPDQKHHVRKVEVQITVLKDKV